MEFAAFNRRKILLEKSAESTVVGNSKKRCFSRHYFFASWGPVKGSGARWILSLAFALPSLGFGLERELAIRSDAGAPLGVCDLGATLDMPDRRLAPASAPGLPQAAARIDRALALRREF